MFQRIVAGVTKTTTARSVADQAIEIANALGADLHLVSCYDPSELSDRPVDQHATAFLDGLRARAAGTVETHVLAGDPTRAILSVAQACDADLIVVGNKGMHGARRFLGSVPSAISHQASCAVLILPTT